MDDISRQMETYELRNLHRYPLLLPTLGSNLVVHDQRKSLLRSPSAAREPCVDSDPVKGRDWRYEERSNHPLPDSRVNLNECDFDLNLVFRAKEGR